MGILELSSSLPFLVFRLRRTREVFMRSMVKQTWASGAAILLGTLLCSNARSAQIDDLNTRVKDIQNTVSETTPTVMGDLSVLEQTNHKQCALLVGPVATTSAGSTVDWPITFIPGPDPIAALQVDFLLPSNLSIESVVAGPAATDATKSVAFSSSTNRALLFGFNQTPIGNGVVAIVTLKLVAVSTPGIYPAILSNPVAADGMGNAVPLC